MLALLLWLRGRIFVRHIATILAESQNPDLLGELVNLPATLNSCFLPTFTMFTTVTTVGSARGPETLGSFLNLAVAAAKVGLEAIFNFAEE